MIDIAGNTARQRHLVKMIRLMMSLERVFANNVKPVINSQFINTAAAIDMGVGGIDFVIEQYNFRLRTIYEKNYRRIAKIFFDEAMSNFDTGKGISPTETKTMAEDFWNELNIWIRIEAARRVKKINDTTKKVLKKIVKTGIEEGQSNANIAKKIREVGKISSKSRAATIARTETHTAANHSIQTTMEKTRIRMEKEWVSAKDARVRIDHNLADGERVPINEMFQNTGEPMEYPGDPSGSAWNVVNCRCIVIYHTLVKAIRALNRGLRYAA